MHQKSTCRSDGCAGGEVGLFGVEGLVSADAFLSMYQAISDGCYDLMQELHQQEAALPVSEHQKGGECQVLAGVCLMQHNELAFVLVASWCAAQ